MKKSYLKYIIITFIIFILNTSNVMAEKKCVYGNKDDEGKWNKKITLNLGDENNFINLAESPLLTRDGFKSIYKEPGTANGVSYEYKLEKDYAVDFELYIGLPNNEDICPPKINYGEWSNGCDDFSMKNQECLKTLGGQTLGDVATSLMDKNNVAIFTEMYRNEAQKFINSAVLYEKLELEKTGKNKEESKNLKYDCSDFSIAMDSIDKTISESDSKSCDNNPKFEQSYNDLKNLCISYSSSFSYNDADDEAKSCMKACNALNDEIDDKCSVEPPKGAYCGTFGNDMINWIIKIFKYVRYGLPAILIILSVMDFIKAITQEDDSKMKDAQKRFIHRLIAIALLFVIPFLLNFVLRIFNIPGLDAKNPFCIF